MTTANSELLPPGYWVDPETGAWCTIPWPSKPSERRAIAANSLGPQIIAWAEGYTDEPGLIHHLTGKPWRFTPGQKRFILLWWWIDPKTGRFKYRSAIKRGAKGTGKDPFGGALGNCGLLGPVELDHWGENGPVGRRRHMPLVQVLSNSEEQSKDLMRVANGQWSEEARAYYGLDIGQTRTIIKKTGGRFEIVTASEKSAEGDPVTDVFLNETHHMTESSGGLAIAKVARRNAAKSPREVQARVIELTNAHRKGQGSAAEQSFMAWQKQLAPGYRDAKDILYDSIEASPATDILTRAGRMAGLRAAYMDAPWTDLERICDEMMDERVGAAEALRYYMNGLAANEDDWVAPERWDALATRLTIPAKWPIALFLDCSKSGDATALVACTLWKPYVFKVGVWERPSKLPKAVKWQVPRDSVEAAIRETFEERNVVWFGIDPSPAKDDGDNSDALYWQPLIDKLTREYSKKVRVPASTGPGQALLFDMRLSTPGGKARMFRYTRNAEYFARLVDDEGLDGPLRHDGDPDMRRHVHNAKARSNPWGISLGKVTRDSSAHVDLAVAAVGALLGARTAEATGKVYKPRTIPF